MKKLIVANWKMNSLMQESKERLEKLVTLLANYKGNVELLICPSSPQIAYVVEQVKKIPIAKVGGQDCHYKESGAFTGDVSAKMLKEQGCDAVILGHVERRSVHFETDEIVRQKAERAIESGLRAIICSGGVKNENKISIKTQLSNSLPKSGVTGDNIIIAHEPIFAIGTGLVPTSSEIEEIHQQMREVLENIYGKDIANQIKILYGGSVTADNAKEILSIKNVDGLLVGGVSLIAEDLVKIIEICN